MGLVLESILRTQSPRKIPQTQALWGGGSVLGQPRLLGAVQRLSGPGQPGAGLKGRESEVGRLGGGSRTAQRLLSRLSRAPGGHTVLLWVLCSSGRQKGWVFPTRKFPAQSGDMGAGRYLASPQCTHEGTRALPLLSCQLIHQGA